jgi:uncharacterized protein (TIGR02301 family)
MRRWLAPAAALAACLAIAGPLAAQQRPQRAPQTATPQPAPAPQPEPPELPLAYEPQLLQLAETLGVLAYMSELCGDDRADLWRQRAEQIIEAEAGGRARKERLAGAYNRGFSGHQAAHRRCGDRSRLVIETSLQDARRITQDIANRYGG